MKQNDFIQGLPKAELHLHIEGTLEPELMLKLAKKNNVKLKYGSVAEIRKAYEFKNLQEFLDIYYQGSSVLITKEDFFELTYAYLKKAHEDSVVHVEIFFDPQSHTHRGISFKTVIEGIHGALEAGKKDFNMSSCLIMCFLRHLSEEDALKTLEQAIEFKNYIKAVGLDSSEVGHPPKKFQNVFKLAKEHGFEAVAHAGEEGPAQYIWDALNDLNVSRIDHGVRCIDDKVLINKLVEDKIPLTVCPLSNLKLKVFKTLSNHNIKILFDKGVCVTINSDDPSYFGGYIAENFKQCCQALNFSRKDLCQLAKNSFQASFIPYVEKLKFYKCVDEYYKNFV